MDKKIHMRIERKKLSPIDHVVLHRAFKSASRKQSLSGLNKNSGVPP